MLQALRLLDENEHDAACNRAYYAVFEASHAALSALGVPEPKTHRGLNSQFQYHVVKTNLVDPDAGGLLSKIEDNRLLADYVEDVIPEHKAREAVDMAVKFVETVDSRLALISGKALDRGMPAQGR